MLYFIQSSEKASRPGQRREAFYVPTTSGVKGEYSVQECVVLSILLWFQEIVPGFSEISRRSEIFSLLIPVQNRSLQAGCLHH